LVTYQKFCLDSRSAKYKKNTYFDTFTFVLSDVLSNRDMEAISAEHYVPVKQYCI